MAYGSRRRLQTGIRGLYGFLQDDELTLRDIGEILNLSRERVRQS
jgi:DNA-directed RNA polymerase sigma subunit (sigma70/sigma32)